MLIRPKDYDRNRKKRKEYIRQSEFSLDGVNVSKENHDACICTLEGVMSKGLRDALQL